MNTMDKQVDKEYEDAALHELTKLERRFRAMRKDEESCPKDVRTILNKQNQLIKLLEEEKHQILKQISFSKSKPLCKAQENLKKKVSSLVADHDELSAEIEKKRNDLKDLQHQIKLLQMKVDDAKKEKARVEPNAESVKKDECADENLKTRLHVEAVRFNQLMTENERLRQETENLLNEKDRFSKNFKSLSAELATGKKIICDLIEQSIIAHNRRKEAEIKLNALKNKATYELLHNCSEAQKIQMKLEHNLKLNQFMGTKSQKRISELVEKEKSAKQEGAMREIEEYLEKYSNIVNNIKERFGENDLDQLVREFKKLEEDNFNMYSFINELNMKLEAMRNELSILHKQIVDQRQLNCANRKEWATIIENLENEVGAKRHTVFMARETLKVSKENLNRLLSGIQDLFGMVSCDPGPIRAMLGKNCSVTAANVLLYLKTLETRLQEVSTIANYQLQRATPRKSRNVRNVVKDNIGRKICQPVTLLPGQPCPLCAAARDISEVDESLAAPLDTNQTREQLREELKTGSRADLVHTVAECSLPKSRRIIQKRRN